jgi:hypothetical protein
MPDNRYNIPDNITRRQRRSNVKTISKILKDDMRDWKLLEKWFKTLSEEEQNQAVNFKHEDATVNIKAQRLAALEQRIVYYAKYRKELEKRKKQNTPTVNGNNKEISALRASI